MEEDIFVVKINVQNKDKNIKVEIKEKDVKEGDLEKILKQQTRDILDIINK
ncbi:MAG: hypothetical protein ACOCRK_10480 [bacterium]